MFFYIFTCNWHTSCISIHWLWDEHWAQRCRNVFCQERKSPMYVPDGTMVVTLLLDWVVGPQLHFLGPSSGVLKSCCKNHVLLLTVPVGAGLTVYKVIAEVHELTLAFESLFVSSSRNHLESDMNHITLETWKYSVCCSTSL